METKISRQLTNNVKAVAIVLIMFEHIAKKYFLSESTANILGVCGVCCFLFLSGYGVFVSYVNNGVSVKKYWSDKINKIFIPYSVITVIFSFFLK